MPTAAINTSGKMDALKNAPPTLTSQPTRPNAYLAKPLVLLAKLPPRPVYLVPRAFPYKEINVSLNAMTNFLKTQKTNAYLVMLITVFTVLTQIPVLSAAVLLI